MHLPALSPDGRTVAFAALNSLWISRRLRAERAPRRVVRAGPPTTYLQAPSWTADGQRAGVRRRPRRHSQRRPPPRPGHRQGDGARLRRPGACPRSPRTASRLACLDMAGNLVVRDLARRRGEDARRAAGRRAGCPGGRAGRRTAATSRYCDRNRLNQRFREGYNLIRVVDTTHRDRSVLHAVAPHASLSDRYDCGPVWSPDGRHMALRQRVRAVAAPGPPGRHPRRRAASAHRRAGRPSLLVGRLAQHCCICRRAGCGSWTWTSGTPYGPRSRSATGARPPADTVVHAGRFWDGTGGGARREDVDVAGAGRPDRRRRTAPRARAPRPSGRTVDASGPHGLPGLWDAHTHPWQYTYGGRQTAAPARVRHHHRRLARRLRLRTGAAARGRSPPARWPGRGCWPPASFLTGPRRVQHGPRAPHPARGSRRSLDRGGRARLGLRQDVRPGPGLDDGGGGALRATSGSACAPASHLCTPGIQTRPGPDDPSAGDGAGWSSAMATTADGPRLPGRRRDLHAPRGFRLIATPFTALSRCSADDPVAGRGPAGHRD